MKWILSNAMSSIRTAVVGAHSQAVSSGRTWLSSRSQRIRRQSTNRIFRSFIIALIVVGPFYRNCSAQQTEAPEQHSFLDWKNTTLMSIAAGGHVWAAKEYNGPQYAAFGSIGIDL